MLANYKQLLTEVIALKSVSTGDPDPAEIKKTYTWFADLFRNNGFETSVIEGYDNPVIVASYENDPDQETCLIYGHYDVQPALIEDGWHQDPFEVLEKDGKLIGRGVVDNKGQVLVHIVSILDLIQRGELAYNIKFFIEGNEETGSPHIARCIEDHRDLLSSDFIIVSDGELTANLPTIEASLRGSMNITLRVKTADKEVHSGMYGGAIPNAAHELSKIIAGFYSEDNTINIEGFYENSGELTNEKLENNASIPFDKDMIFNNTGAKAFVGEQGLDFYSQVGLRPTLQVTGFSGGYVGAGFRNSIPAEATAKINIRVTGKQDPLEIVRKIDEHVGRNIPEYVDYSVEIPDRYEAAAGAVEIDTRSKYVNRVVPVLEDVFSSKIVKKYVGGTLPIISHFGEILNRPIVMVPLANEDCGMHSPNENFDLKVLKKSLEFSNKFFSTDE